MQYCNELYYIGYISCQKRLIYQEFIVGKRFMSWGISNVFMWKANLSILSCEQDLKYLDFYFLNCLHVHSLVHEFGDECFYLTYFGPVQSLINVLVMGQSKMPITKGQKNWTLKFGVHLANKNYSPWAEFFLNYLPQMRVF
jgi:hypothetical protein